MNNRTASKKNRSDGIYRLFHHFLFLDMTKKQAISLNYAFIVIARDVHSIPDAVRPFQVC